MASSRGSFHTPDWRDVRGNISALQHDLSVIVRVAIYCGGTVDAPDLVVFASGMSDPSKSTAHLHSASASVSCRLANVQSLDAAIIKALYELDRAFLADRKDGMG